MPFPPILRRIVARITPALPPLAVDFAPPRRSRIVRSWPGVLLLLAGLAAAAAVALDLAAIEARADSAAARVATLRKAIARQARAGQVDTVAGRGSVAGNADGKAAATAADEIRHARKIAIAVAAPWDAVLRELEAAAGPQVALLTLDADAGTRSMRLGAEAASADEAFAYAARLGESEHFDEVAIVAHEEKQVAGKTVFSFTLIIVWSAPS